MVLDCLNIVVKYDNLVEDFSLALICMTMLCIENYCRSSLKSSQ